MKNPSAFPVAGSKMSPGEDGMTLLDYFAAKVLPQIIADDCIGMSYNVEDISSKSYLIAEAMLKEREKRMKS